MYFNFLDKSLILWKLTREENNYGVPQKRLHGHSHFITDVVSVSHLYYMVQGGDMKLKARNRIHKYLLFTGSFSGWSLRSLWIMGQDPSSVGSCSWQDHPSL